MCPGCPCVRLLPVPGIPLAVAVYDLVVSIPASSRPASSRRQRWRPAAEALDVVDLVPGRRQHQLDITTRGGCHVNPVDHQGCHEGRLLRLQHQLERRLRPQRRSLPRRLPVRSTQRHLPSSDTRRRASNFGSRTHRLATIHTSQADDRRTQHCSIVDRYCGGLKYIFDHIIPQEIHLQDAGNAVARANKYCPRHVIFILD